MALRFLRTTVNRVFIGYGSLSVVLKELILTVFDRRKVACTVHVPLGAALIVATRLYKLNTATCARAAVESHMSAILSHAISILQHRHRLQYVYSTQYQARRRSLQHVSARCRARCLALRRRIRCERGLSLSTCRSSRRCQKAT